LICSTAQEVLKTLKLKCEVVLKGRGFGRASQMPANLPGFTPEGIQAASIALTGIRQSPVSRRD
jgi:hypothetical protein